jgi:PAS domain S-box-containing protein
VLSKPCSRAELRARVHNVISLNRFRALAEERFRFERLFELSPAAIVLTDTEGRILAANREAENGLAREAEADLCGTWIADHFAAPAATALRTLIAGAADHPSPRPCHLEHGTGDSRRHYSVRSTTVPEGPGNRIMLVFDDLSAEVRAREELEKLNAGLEDMVQARTRQLEEANALLLSYANFVTHDLRGPLTAVRGYLGLLHEIAPELPGHARPLVGHAFQGSHQMAEMIDSILQLAHDMHEGEGGPGPALDPGPVLQRLVAHVLSGAPNPRTEFLMHGPLPAVGVSAAVLERIFFNLLANAAKYSANQHAPLLEIGAAGGPDDPVLYVRDNGVGFAADDCNRLFQDFTRLSSASGTEGIGLGLSLVARLVKSQGGRIWAESSPGQGATFFVRLPAPAISKRAGAAAA